MKNREEKHFDKVLCTKISSMCFAVDELRVKKSTLTKANRHKLGTESCVTVGELKNFLIYAKCLVCVWVGLPKIIVHLGILHYGVRLFDKRKTKSVSNGPIATRSNIDSIIFGTKTDIFYRLLLWRLLALRRITLMNIFADW